MNAFAKLENEVVKIGLCTDCGTCVGVCPNRAIAMNYSKEEPEAIGECPPQCNLCNEVCPGKNIPMLAFDRMLFGRERSPDEMLLGIGQSFSKCHAVDPVFRANGGGGGVVSALLIHALESSIIDAAIVVTMSKERPWVAIPSIATNRDEVIAASQAKETLVPVNSILGEVLEKGFRRLGIVGLPCHIHGIRKAQLVGKPEWVATHLKLLIGLFCGGNYSFRATEHIIGEWAEVPLEQVAKVEYRAGEYPGTFTVTTKDGEAIGVPLRARRHVYQGHEHDRCLVCYDYANEAADVSIGDYFALEMTRGAPGQSTTIIRTDIGKKLIEDAKVANYIHTEPVEMEDFYRGGFESKKHGGAFRIFERRRYSLPYPDFQLPLDFRSRPRKLNLTHPLIS